MGTGGIRPLPWAESNTSWVRAHTATDRRFHLPPTALRAVYLAGLAAGGACCLREGRLVPESLVPALSNPVEPPPGAHALAAVAHARVAGRHGAARGRARAAAGQTTLSPP